MSTATAPAPPPESTTVTGRGTVRAISAVTGIVADVGPCPASADRCG